MITCCPCQISRNFFKLYAVTRIYLGRQRKFSIKIFCSSLLVSELIYLLTYLVLRENWLAILVWLPLCYSLNQFYIHFHKQRHIDKHKFCIFSQHVLICTCMHLQAQNCLKSQTDTLILFIWYRCIHIGNICLVGFIELFASNIRCDEQHDKRYLLVPCTKFPDSLYLMTSLLINFFQFFNYRLSAFIVVASIFH